MEGSWIGRNINKYPTFFYNLIWFRPCPSRWYEGQGHIWRNQIVSVIISVILPKYRSNLSITNEVIIILSKFNFHFYLSMYKIYSLFKKLLPIIANFRDSTLFGLFSRSCRKLCPSLMTIHSETKKLCQMFLDMNGNETVTIVIALLFFQKMSS